MEKQEDGWSPGRQAAPIIEFPITRLGGPRFDHGGAGASGGRTAACAQTTLERKVFHVPLGRFQPGTCSWAFQHKDMAQGEGTRVNQERLRRSGKWCACRGLWRRNRTGDAQQWGSGAPGFSEARRGPELLTRRWGRPHLCWTFPGGPFTSRGGPASAPSRLAPGSRQRCFEAARVQAASWLPCQVSVNLEGADRSHPPVWSGWFPEIPLGTEPLVQGSCWDCNAWGFRQLRLRPPMTPPPALVQASSTVVYGQPAPASESALYGGSCCAGQHLDLEAESCSVHVPRAGAGAGGGVLAWVGAQKMLADGAKMLDSMSAGHQP